MTVAIFCKNIFIVTKYHMSSQLQSSPTYNKRTHVFVPFHTIFFIALHGNGPEIQD